MKSSIQNKEIKIYECEICGFESESRTNVLGCESIHVIKETQKNCKHDFKYDPYHRGYDDETVIARICTKCNSTTTKSIYNMPQHMLEQLFEDA